MLWLTLDLGFLSATATEFNRIMGVCVSACMLLDNINHLVNFSGNYKGN